MADKENTMEEEIEEAKKQAKSDSALEAFTINFKKPLTWEGKEYSSLTFDWGKLTGEDFLSIEEEINQEGYAVVTPEFSTRFLFEMAARCCEEKIDKYAIRKLPIGPFTKIRSHARSFLLRSEI